MEKMTAFCGLACTKCEAYQATHADNDKKKVKIAKLWSKRHNMNLERQDINCDGCKSGSDRLFGFCRSCEVRKCALAKSIDTCAQCTDYPCDKLNPIFMAAPGLKTQLDSIRKEVTA